MTARILSGKDIAKEIRKELKVDIEKMKEEIGVTPGLAVVLVGENPASQVYVRNKKKTAAKLGIKSFDYDLPADTSEAKLLGLIDELNANAEVHGILVQLPLPKHIDEETILNAVPLAKDVAGFHPLNIGALAMKGREGDFIPCTPNGVIELLKRSGTEMSGANAVVLESLPERLVEPGLARLARFKERFSGGRRATGGSPPYPEHQALAERLGS